MGETDSVLTSALFATGSKRLFSGESTCIKSQSDLRGQNQGIGYFVRRQREVVVGFYDSG